MRKCTALLLVTCLVVSSLMVILPASLAQTKPATPTIFTAGFSDEIDSYYVDVKNQPFTPYVVNGSTVYLYYQVQVKDHAADDNLWVLVNPTPVQYVIQTDSQYTRLTIPVYYNGQKLDIQVRALIGFVEEVEMWWQIVRPISYQFKGVEGDWSNIQTFTLNRSILPTSSVSQNTPPSNTSPANTDTPMPSQLEPGFDGKVKWTIGGFVLLTVIMFVVLVVMVIVMVILLLRKRAKV